MECLCDKVALVNWEDMCKTKRDGGLGVRDYMLVNIALLSKWR